MAVRTVWILGDQLLEEHPALEAARAEGEARDVVVLLIESYARLSKQSYHRKKITLLLSSMRHYCHALETQGVRVDYRRSRDVTSALQAHLREVRPESLWCMQASEYRGRAYQEKLVEQLTDIRVQLLPNSQFLLGRHHPFPDVPSDRAIRMETFYRRMRTHFDVLMQPDGEPVGGRWNYDRENRRRLPAGMAIPPLISIPPDSVTNAVMDEVERMTHLAGSTKGFDLAVTHEDAQAALSDFLENRLAQFGPYEDAMRENNRTLFHAFLSPYLNLGLLEPLAVVRAAEVCFNAGTAPLPSVEGFIRQVLGWREYIYWQYWRVQPEAWKQNAWAAHRPLPAFFWDADTDMACLRNVLKGIHAHGYTHHIERLMLLTNFAMLCSLDPHAVNTWFLGQFVDAYEWVMFPNVLGMGLHADNGRVGSKPYISSANYIRKMSDFCASCRYDAHARTGDQACPFNFLYWNFLLEHEERLRSQPRLGRNVLGLRYLGSEEREQVRREARAFLAALQARAGGT